MRQIIAEDLPSGQRGGWDWLLLARSFLGEWMKKEASC